MYAPTVSLWPCPGLHHALGQNFLFGILNSAFSILHTQFFILNPLHVMQYPNDAISIPITPKMHQTAQAFAQFQPTPEKQAQVVSNLLAVQVVNHYLSILGVETLLTQSDCWNPVGQLAADVADLKLADGDRLECRPVQPNATHCPVPPEVWRERLGYVVVALEEKAGKILGFVGAIATELLPLKQLQPLDTLLVQLDRDPFTALGDWLNQQFAPSLDQGWTTVVDFAQGRLREPAMAFRARSLKGAESSPEQLRGRLQQLYASAGSAVGTHDLASELAVPSDPKQGLMQLIRAIPSDEELRWQAADLLWTLEPEHSEVGIRRLLDVGMLFAGQSVALMVGLLPRPDGNRAVLLRLYPMKQGYLPPGIELVGCDGDGETFLMAQAREVDDYIQLKFAAEPEEQFSVKVLLNGVGITESFSA